MSNRSNEDLRSDYLQQRICAFIERHAPRSYEGRDFEYELRSILAQVYEQAQRPFVRELELYRAQSWLKPIPETVKAAEKRSKEG